MNPTWVILTPLAAIGIAVAVRRLRRMRADREWARGIAQRVHDRGYLEWLEEQFASEGSAQ
jgi:hypothetical protein